MKKVVIFDLDGTLLNTLADLADCTNAVLSAHGFPVHPEEAYRYFVGDGAWNQMRRALPAGTDEETVVQVHDEYMALYSENSMNRTCPYPGIPALLSRLKQDGCALAVCSNKPDARTKEMIAHYFPGAFDCVIGHVEGAPVKPDPGIVRQILEALDAENARVFYVGDTATDVKTAKNAFLPCAGVLWGFRDRSELESAGADRIAVDPEELYTIISEFFAE